MIILKKTITRLLELLGYRIYSIRIESNAEYFSFIKFLNYYLEKHNPLNLIQIGANDGITFDPVHNFIIQNQEKVKAILVEPIEYSYNKLRENYKEYSNVITENIAIHKEKKEMTMYLVNPEKLAKIPKWAGGTASFNLEHHKLSKIPSEFIIEKKVSCITLNELLKKHDIQQLDILQIDTEGYDYDIIKSINFNVIKPSIIRFEHGYMDNIMTKEKIIEILDILNKNGYQIIMESYDATAYLPFKII
ncbi:MAG TPA: FkbM family methyltransferase [Victivallales bacterium]|nr:FkbM family methyltransferase [Victivallales bacterium]HRU00427.1 FkbM family methyltransferase [Victivallales bacterium]